MLEKHKDYTLRAKDFKEKKKRLKTLKEKAADRNPDEFHFGMTSSRMQDGRKIGSRGNAVLEMDKARLLKTQDAGYIRTLLQKTRLEREELEAAVQIVDEDGIQELRLLDGRNEGMGKHTVFVETVEEQKAFDPKEWFNTDAKGLAQRHNRRRRKSDASTHDGDKPSTKPIKTKPRGMEDEEATRDREEREQERRLHKQEVRRNYLEALRQRENTLSEAAEELDIQRNRMNNNPGSVTKKGDKIRALILKRKR